ncbi:peptide chain release factor N(5)-glutamine methyltransferase [Pseudotabrizicola alkalilacus]|uniref:Release factor glutamine methyltransferase n=1 Tax=Pseudotabrizicola alkalilacus TaxID=2305252 RepID=A0A411YZ65_9RHOB|nr:peptide chain release factor N(5)-glutamine methyltransferase [Pseudotabrizicola alkalilacus]RGP36098.1 peptide chain release factor N(5)-glutamine methyltransferase [Pseudotabrizicola alkalilacus]
MTTLSVALVQAVRDLRAGGVPDAAGDARVLLAHAAGIAPDRLTLHLPDAAAADVLARFATLIVRRAAREPVSHLTGGRLFWGRRFIVTPDVLDPRPETETLVAEALRTPFDRVLDLGTGSGAIVLSLLADQVGAQGLGVDLSGPALQVAQRNADALGLTGRCRFAHGAWFAPVSGQFDLIVSNPPYITAAEMADLSPEVQRYEPHLALTPGGDGLDAYRAIAAGVAAHLAPTGRLLLEIGPTQAAAVVQLLAQAGLGQIRVLPDMDGRDRVVAAQAG